MTDRLVLLAYEAWDDLDRAVAELGPEDATTRRHGGSSIAWTVAHVTQMLDSWINTNFQEFPRHPVIGDPRFRTGGTGDWDDWVGVVTATQEVRAKARQFLDSEQAIDKTVPYDGSIEFLRETGLRLDYALMRISAHHWLHADEIVALRSGLGHDTDQYFGPDWGRDLT